MRHAVEFFFNVLIFIVLNLSINAIANADNSLIAEQWELSRSGEKLIKLPVIKNIVNQWSKSSNQSIELHYPGGEEGELWVEELRNLLVSLGIPSKYIIIAPGSGVEDVIKLYVVRKGESYQ